MQEIIISGLQNLYGLEPVIGNPYAKIDKSGMHFKITTYKVKGFGRLSVIDMKAMLGLMKMESVVVNASKPPVAAASAVASRSQRSFSGCPL